MLERNGLSLLELVIVLFILAAIAAIAVPMMSSTQTDSREKLLDTSIFSLRDILIRYWNDTKYINFDTDSNPATENKRFQLKNLFVAPCAKYNPQSMVGWNGPYVVNKTGDYQITDTDLLLSTGTNFTAEYGDNGDPTLIDIYGMPFVVQNLRDSTTNEPLKIIRIVSAGEDKVLTLHPTKLVSELTELERGDDVYLEFSVP